MLSNFSMLAETTKVVGAPHDLCGEISSQCMLIAWRIVNNLACTSIAIHVLHYDNKLYPFVCCANAIP